MADTQDLMQMRPIGYLRSVFQYKNGTPRQPSLCSAARGSLTVDKSVFNNPEHALEGLEQFSHAWIVFVFHKNKPGHSKAKVKPPRLNGKRVGVFSTRSPYRPNAIGLTLAKIERISGATVHFSGIDIVDGTPILDIKPFIPQYDVPACRGEPCTNSTDECISGNTFNVISDCFSEDIEQVAGYNCSSADKLSSNCCYNSQTSTCQNCSSPNDGQSGGCIPTEDLSLRSNGFSESHSTHLSTQQQAKTCLVPSSHILGHSAREAITERDMVPEKVSPDTLNSDKRVMSVELFSTVISAKADFDCLTGNALLNPKKNQDLESVTQQKRTAMVSSGIATNVNLEPQDTGGVTSLSMNGFSPKSVEKQPLADSKRFEECFSSTEQLEQNTSNAFGLVNMNADRSKTSIAAWLSAPPISKLAVSFTPTAEMQLEKFVVAQKSDASGQSLYMLDFLSGKEEIQEAIISVLSEDPRSVYRREKCKDALYFFTVDMIHVTCWFDENRAEVVRLQPLALVEKLNQKVLKIHGGLV